MSVRFEQVFVDRHEIEVEERGDSIYVELGFVQDYHVYEARFPMPSDAMIVGTVKTEGELTVENVTIERGVMRMEIRLVDVHGILKAKVDIGSCILHIRASVLRIQDGNPLLKNGIRVLERLERPPESDLSDLTFTSETSAGEFPSLM